MTVRMAPNTYKYTHMLLVAFMLLGIMTSCVEAYLSSPPSRMFQPSALPSRNQQPTKNIIVNMRVPFVTKLNQASEDMEALSNQSQQQEFDIDTITSIEELNVLSRGIGGPVIDPKFSSLESAKDQIWAYVEDTAENDIDKMCMGQLAGLMIEMGGEEFGDDVTIEEARDQVYDLAYKLSCPAGDNCSCC